MGSEPSALAERAYAAHRAAENAFHAALTSEYPVGSTITYRHGTHSIVAEVVQHSRDCICLIRDSGVRYWRYWDSTFRRLS